MINIFKTEQSVIRTIDAFEDGAWVPVSYTHLTLPTSDLV